MPKFLIFGLEMENNQYYKSSLSLDMIIVLMTIVAYFSNELIVSSSIAIVCTIFTILFSALLAVSIIKFCKGKSIEFVNNKMKDLEIQFIIFTFTERLFIYYSFLL